MERFVIAFDLDGTLVDTAPDLIATADRLLARMGAEPLEPQAGRIAAGRGARALLEAGLTASERPLPSGDEWPGLIADFIALYRGRIAERSRPFPGVAAFLEEQRARGFGLAVCTNKMDYLATELLEALGLADFFDSVTGANTTGAGKPDPAPLLHCIDEAGGRAPHALLIGDSRADILAARAAGAHSALAAWGYLDRPAGAYQADYAIPVIADAAALVDALAQNRPEKTAGGI